MWVLALEGPTRIRGQLLVQAVWSTEGGRTDNYKEEGKTGKSGKTRIGVHGGRTALRTLMSAAHI